MDESAEQTEADQPGVKLKSSFFLNVPEHDEYKSRNGQNNAVSRPHSSAYEVLGSPDGTLYVYLADIKKANKEELGRGAVARYAPDAVEGSLTMMVEYPECTREVDMRRIIFKCPSFALVRLCTEFVVPADPDSSEIKFDATYFAYDLVNHRILEEWTFSNQADFDWQSYSSDEMVHYIQPREDKSQLQVRKYTYWYYQLQEVSLFLLLGIAPLWEDELLQDVLEQLDCPQRSSSDQ